MSDHSPRPEAPAAEPQPEPQPQSEQQPEQPQPRRRSALAVTVAAVVVLAVAGGAGFTVLKVNDADRTVRAQVWGEPEQGKQRAGASSGADLMTRLLPVPEGYTPGPDIDEFGNEKVITGREATARFKKSADNLPSSQREAQHRAIDKLKVKGLAVRSYAADSGDLVVETQLAEIQNRQAGRGIKEFRSGFLRALGVFGKGPKIKGHRNADCFRAPRDKKTGLDLLTCSAYQDDLLVAFTAYGPAAIDGKAVAELLAQQLDHIASRGELI
ncbi:hypothetical protein [Streptomyces sp. NPDC088785]|uniref:hypothetical protein n=1 Tax=Streptomyces sp. NPDC088785 TaxID=3365897 RepID=UPI0037F39624